MINWKHYFMLVSVISDQDSEQIKIRESDKTPIVLGCRATPAHTNGEYEF